MMSPVRTAANGSHIHGRRYLAVQAGAIPLWTAAFSIVFDCVKSAEIKGLIAIWYEILAFRPKSGNV